MSYKLDGAKFPTLEDLVEALYPIYSDKMSEEEFKKYAKLINNAYGYDISRVGDKKKDYEKSNIEYNEGQKYNYRVVCKGCKQEFYRQRINKDFVKKYVCGKCKSKFEVVRIK